MIERGTLGGYASYANALNERGQIVVNGYPVSGWRRAVWQGAAHIAKQQLVRVALADLKAITTAVTLDWVLAVGAQLCLLPQL